MNKDILSQNSGTSSSGLWERIIFAIIGIATLIGLFYIMENIRGKHAWEKQKALLQANGRLVKWTDLIPPSVPDASNIFMAPKMMDWFVGPNLGRGQTEFTKILSSYIPTNTENIVVAKFIPATTNNSDFNGSPIYSLQKSNDAVKVVNALSSAMGPYRQNAQQFLTFLSKSPSQIKPQSFFIKSEHEITVSELSRFLMTLPQNKHWKIEATKENTFLLRLNNVICATDFLSATEPSSAEFAIISDALKRPLARINCDYSDPDNVAIPNFVVIRETVQFLHNRAQCFIMSGQADKAVHELAIINDLRRLLERKPTGKPKLIDTMINTAVVILYTSMVEDGLRMHVWGEPELIELQKQLTSMDLFPLFQETVTNQDALALFFINRSGSTRSPQVQSQQDLFYKLIPRGWYYQGLVYSSSFLLRFEDLIRDQPYISSEKVTALNEELQNTIKSKWTYKSFANIWVYNFEKATQQLAKSQTRANLNLIVCALERYRLTNHHYPNSLSELSPTYLSKIPQDIIGGQPLHYKCDAGKQFTLYSVGWNEADDGGKPEKDWVWPDQVDF